MHPDQRPPRLHLQLLGDMQLTFDGAPLGGKLYGKVLALLAYLSVEAGRSHTRERLAELLWPGMPVEAARANLRQALYYLRQALGGDQGAAEFLAAGREAVRFAAEGPHRLDVREFSATLPLCGATPEPAKCGLCIAEMERRAALYRGPFMSDLQVPDAPEFEEWRDARREALHREMLALLERVSQCQARQGALDRALTHARRYTAMEPWDEAGHRQVMRLLAAAGQRSAALAQYEACRALLQRELAVAPAPATTELFLQIRDGLPEPAVAMTTPAEFARKTERRPVTALYCCLNVPGTTDAEEIGERLLEPQRRCLELVRHYGGHVAPSHGGTVLAYFGYPAAFEDAARRAVRAALALSAPRADGVTLRTGVHTGVIVAQTDPQLPEPAGVVSKVALRLCDRAQIDGVVISDATHRLVAGYFHAQALEPVPLSESAQPLRVFRVTGETGVSTRIDAASRLLPLVGRRVELEQLKALWQAAWTGRGQRVLLRGDAGMGKSRLLRELRESLAGNAWSVRELQGLPEYQHSPLHPVIALLERLLAVGPDDTPEVRRELVDAYLETYHAAWRSEAFPLLTELLGIAEQPSALPPETHREKSIEILLKLLSDAARKQPLLLAVEDLHWMDASTLALLEMAARAGGDALPVLWVYTTRPDFQPAWLGEDCLVMDLAPLNDEEMTILVNEAEADLPAETVRRIVARADGVPLFGEEMARLSVESDDGDIPATLHYLLLTRLDGLGEARRLAQLAATVGREFDRELLRRLVDGDERWLDAMLVELLEARLIVATHEAGTRFQFRHALIQEAAYQSQSRTDRRTAHRRVAEALTTFFPQRAAHLPEQVAHHFSEGGAAAQAIPWWIAAAREALRANANGVAVDHLQTGLALTAQQPAGAARDDLELQQLLLLGRALLQVRGYGSAETAAIYDRAMALCGETATAGQRFEALWGQWMVSSSRADSSFAVSADLAGALRTVAKHGGGGLHRAYAHSAAANVALWQGRLDEAVHEAQRAVALGAERRDGERLVGHDPVVAACGYLGWALFAKGAVADAVRASEQGIAEARALDHPDSLGFALVHAATLRRLMRDPAAVAALAQEALALGGHYGLPLWQGAGAMLLGWTQAATGDEGLELLEAGAAGVRQIMPGVLNAFLHPLAEAHGFLGEGAAQLRVADEAIQAAERLHERFHLADLHRLRGEALARLGRADEALRALGEAMRISEEQGAEAFRLRAAVAAADVLQGEGRLAQAKELLRPVVARWGEESPPDLAAARALLAPA